MWPDGMKTGGDVWVSPAEVPPMLCFEVTVNGKPYCVAGAHGRFFAAGVAGEVHLRVRRIGGMKVSACGASADATEWYRWDGREYFLRVGDVVNVAIVERDTPDAPARSRS